MMTMTVLASGSKGNACLVECNGQKLLIDAGISAKQLVLRLNEVGVQPEELAGVLVTHEHLDHTRGLEVFCRKYEVAVICNRDTAEAIRYKGMDGHKQWKIFQDEQEFELAGMLVSPIRVPHDAADPVCFLLQGGKSSLGVLTDLGMVPERVFQRMQEAELLLVEANYDEDLLRDDVKRPLLVKQRIMSRHGHLSNHEASEVIVRLLEGKLRKVFLGHISRDCNRVDLVQGALEKRLEALGVNTLEFEIALPDTISSRWTTLGVR